MGLNDEERLAYDWALEWYSCMHSVEKNRGKLNAALISQLAAEIKDELEAHLIDSIEGSIARELALLPLKNINFSRVAETLIKKYEPRASKWKIIYKEDNCPGPPLCYTERETVLKRVEEWLYDDGEEGVSYSVEIIEELK